MERRTAIALLKGELTNREIIDVFRLADRGKKQMRMKFLDVVLKKTTFSDEELIELLEISKDAESGVLLKMLIDRGTPREKVTELLVENFIQPTGMFRLSNEEIEKLLLKKDLDEGMEQILIEKYRFSRMKKSTVIEKLKAIHKHLFWWNALEACNFNNKELLELCTISPKNMEFAMERFFKVGKATKVQRSQFIAFLMQSTTRS